GNRGGERAGVALAAREQRTSPRASGACSRTSGARQRAAPIRGFLPEEGTFVKQSTENDVKQLNSFLRGELSAVETYDQCLEKIQNPQLSDTLRELRQSHHERARLLEEKVRQLGGEPSRESGPWG